MHTVIILLMYQVKEARWRHLFAKNMLNALVIEVRPFVLQFHNSISPVQFSKKRIMLDI